MSHTTNASTSSYGTVGYSSLIRSSMNNNNNSNNNSDDDNDNEEYRMHRNNHFSNSSGDHSSFPIIGDESSLITVTNPASSQPASRTRSSNSRETSTFISSHAEPSHSLSKPSLNIGANRMKKKNRKNNSNIEESEYDDNDNDMLKCVLSTGNTDNSTYANDIFDFDSDERKYSLRSSFRGMFYLLRPLKIWLLILCVAFFTLFALLHSDNVLHNKLSTSARIRIKLYSQWGLCIVSLLMLAPVQVWATEMFEDYGLTTFNEHVAAGDEEQSSFTLLSFGNIICAHSPLLILIAMLLILPQEVMVWEVKLLVSGALFLHLLCILGSGLAKLRLPLLSAFACFRSHYSEEEWQEEEEDKEHEGAEEQQWFVKDTPNETAYLLRVRNASQSSQSENVSLSHSQHHSHHHEKSEHQSPHHNSSHHHHHHHPRSPNHHSQRHRESNSVSSPLSPQNMYYKITHYLSSSPFLFYEYYSPHRFNKGHGVLLLSAAIVFLIPSAYKFIYLSDRIPETSFISTNASSLSSFSSLASSLSLSTLTTSSPSSSSFTVASRNVNSTINRQDEYNYARNYNNDQYYYYNNNNEKNKSIFNTMPVSYSSVPYKYAPTQLQTRLLYLSRALSICLILVYGIYVAERCNVFKRASTLYNIITIVEEDANSPSHIKHNKGSRNRRSSYSSSCDTEEEIEDKEDSTERSVVVADESVNVEANSSKRRYRRLNIPPFCGPFLLSMSVVARVCRQCDKFRSRGCDEIAQPLHCRPSHRDAISHTYYSKQFMLFWLVLLLLVQIGLCYVVFSCIRTPAQAELFESYSSLVYFVILPMSLESGHWLAVFMTTSITRTENINAAVNDNNNNNKSSFLVDVTTSSKGSNADNSSVNVVNSIPTVSRNANYEAMLLRNSIDNTLDVMLLIFPFCVIMSWILGANMNLTIHQFVALIMVFVALIICELNWLVQNKYRGPNIPIYTYNNNSNGGGTIWNRGERRNAQLIAVSPRVGKHNNKANSNIVTNAVKGMRRSCSHTCLDETNHTTVSSRNNANNSTNTVFRFHGFVLLIMYVVIIMISYTHNKSYYQY